MGHSLIPCVQHQQVVFFIFFNSLAQTLHGAEKLTETPPKMIHM